MENRPTHNEKMLPGMKNGSYNSEILSCYFLSAHYTNEHSVIKEKKTRLFMNSEKELHLFMFSKTLSLH